MLSIISPAYNEELNIENTASVIGGIMADNDIPYELIFVDDGSTDTTWDCILSAKEKNPNVRGLKFSRNFGKEGAIFAGLRACLGECAVLIDCDLQHPPRLIVEMYSLWQQGYEVVEAVKASRGKESLSYKVFAKMFYKLLKSSSGVNLDRASDFKLMDRKVIDTLNDMPERLTFYRGMSSWVGFKTTQVEFEVDPRAAGETKWSFMKLFKFAMNNLTSFTTLPMQVVTCVGVMFFIFSLILGVYTLAKFFNGQSLAGFSTVILLICIQGTVLMLALGIIGYYISKIYEEIKFRPRYIVSLDTNRKTPVKDTANDTTKETKE